MFSSASNLPEGAQANANGQAGRRLHHSFPSACFIWGRFTAECFLDSLRGSARIAHMCYYPLVNDANDSRPLVVQWGMPKTPIKTSRSSLLDLCGGLQRY